MHPERSIDFRKAVGGNLFARRLAGGTHQFIDREDLVGQGDFDRGDPRIGLEASPDRPNSLVCGVRRLCDLGKRKRDRFGRGLDLGRRGAAQAQSEPHEQSQRHAGSVEKAG